MPQLDFWFSIGSTYSYFTVMRIDAVARAAGVDVTWRVFDVRAIMMEIGNSPFVGKPEKSAHMWRDMERRAPRYGLSPRLPAPYPLSDLALPNRIAAMGLKAGWGIAFVKTAYHQWFEDGRPPDKGPGLANALLASGQDVQAILEAANTPEAQADLAAATQEARDLGIFGSPSFIAGDELFWGDDRLEDAIDWVTKGQLA